MAVKFVDKQDRNVLSEGRNHQMGFAFAKRVGEDTYEAAHPISPCKDYLSDVVWTEHCGKPIHCCGLSYSKKEIFDGKTAYLAIKICDYKHNYGTSYAGLAEDRKRLRDNHPHLQAVLNNVEQRLGLEGRTAVHTTDVEDVFLLALPHFWVRYPYLTSLYALLVRVAQYFGGTKDPAEWLDQFAKGADMYLWNTARPRLRHLIELGHANVPEQPMGDLTNNHPHSSGIVGFTGLNHIKPDQPKPAGLTAG